MEFKNKNITILKYGFGNTGSLKNFFSKLNCYSDISCDPKKILECDILVIPGVGSAVSFFNLIKKETIELIKKRARNKLPIVGICLGGQILFDYHQESESKALSILKGKVIKLNNYNNNWQEVNFEKKNIFFLKKKIISFYFNHQYYISSKNKYLTYFIKNTKIPALIINKNVICIQFHPEKSQKTGLDIFKKIIEYFYGNRK